MMASESHIYDTYSSAEIVGASSSAFTFATSPNTRTITPPSDPADCLGLLQTQNSDVPQKMEAPGWVTSTAVTDSSIHSQCRPTERGPEITTMSQVWSDKNEAVVAGPYNYLRQNPGKGVRAQVMRAFNTWMDVPTDRLKIIANSIDMLHSASLLIDDIQDNSTLRRGLPVAHTIYGVAQTINSANYYYFRAMDELRKLGNAEAIMQFNDELLQLHRGQGMELYWRDLLICPTEDEYLEMISNKTGGLFRLGVKLMQTQSGRHVSPECTCLADLLGLIFQVRDDYQNLCSDAYTDSKGFCDDLTEGKLSFPAVHCISQDPENQELLNILRQRPKEIHVKQYALERMRKTGSLEYTRVFLNRLLVRAKHLIDIISGDPEASIQMHELLAELSI
ncbi:hypothetical protein SCAR479_02834 [Seiridium cardinale]|uniref:Geranylgeranyl diphosphate synthase n=1 Tax=Seiridium cardinale TaxID=138064 RepID=A0ABR2Y289_9PEZI